MCACVCVGARVFPPHYPVRHLERIERVLEAHYLVVHVSLMGLDLVLEALVPLMQLAQLRQGGVEPLAQLGHQALQLL